MTHHDETCINCFAEVMKAKMEIKRRQLGDVWYDLTPEQISKMLREHVEKGDPVDVANFCMMLFVKQARITPEPNRSIKELANRFLGWELPADFYPDAGITFTPPKNSALWPTGTNLLNADQAEMMLRYILR